MGGWVGVGGASSSSTGGAGNYVLSFLANKGPAVADFVVVDMIKLVCRVTKVRAVASLRCGGPPLLFVFANVQRVVMITITLRNAPRRWAGSTRERRCERS